MNIHPYDIELNEEKTIFTFKSSGSKLQKKVVFIQKIPKENRPFELKDRDFYNLGFGDIDENDLFNANDTARTNNGDAETVLRTVAKAAELFLEKKPQAIIMFYGSTKARTRLYRIMLSKYYVDISENFLILGSVDGRIKPFNPKETANYTVFLVLKK